MPRPYTPPSPQRPQAVHSARVRLGQRWRGWWLVPLLGLLPVLAAVVLASQGRLGGSNGQPAATGPLATSPSSASQATQPTTAPNSAGSQASGPQSSAAQAATPNGPQTASAQPTTTAGSQTAPGQSVAAGTSPSQGAGAGGTSNQGAQVSAAPAGGSAASTATGPFRAYAVQPGDTVKFVAQLYGVSPASISQASGLPNPDRLRVGQVLTIPIQPGWLYRVQPGETLDQIAARTGVAMEIILSASRLATDTVRPGDVILIPDQLAAAGK